MTGEEMERAIAFILEQQAQFAANQQRHEETLFNHEKIMHNHEEFMRDHEEAMRHHEEVMRGHEERMGDHEETLSRIEATQEQTALQIRHLGRAMIELTEAHARTESTVAETNEKLTSLIDTVERHISEGRNGKA
jgi:DNA-directed RNA polymerase subunit F